MDLIKSQFLLPKELEKHHKIFICAHKKFDIEKLEQKIFDLYFVGKKPRTEEVYLSTKRQQESAKRTLNALKSALQNIKGQESEEIICLDLETALHELAEIVGETTTEDLLDNIFSNFCIGK